MLMAEPSPTSDEKKKDKTTLQDSLTAIGPEKKLKQKKKRIQSQDNQMRTHYPRAPRAYQINTSRKPTLEPINSSH